LKQAWPQFLYKSSTFLNKEAPKSGIKQLNSIKLPKYTYRNISTVLFHVFLAFDSISMHFQHTNHSPGPLKMVSPR